MEKKLKRFTVALDEGLYKKIKILSVEDGTSLGNLIEVALRKHLERAPTIVINWPSPPSE